MRVTASFQRGLIKVVPLHIRFHCGDLTGKHFDGHVLFLLDQSLDPLQDRRIIRQYLGLRYNRFFLCGKISFSSKLCDKRSDKHLVSVFPDIFDLGDKSLSVSRHGAGFRPRFHGSLHGRIDLGSYKGQVLINNPDYIHSRSVFCALYSR